MRKYTLWIPRIPCFWIHIWVDLPFIPFLCNWICKYSFMQIFRISNLFRCGIQMHEESFLYNDTLCYRFKMTFFLIFISFLRSFLLLSEINWMEIPLLIYLYTHWRCLWQWLHRNRFDFRLKVFKPEFMPFSIDCIYDERNQTESKMSKHKLALFLEANCSTYGQK